jgi:cytochrome bd-type quinol oxidase subunit 1
MSCEFGTNRAAFAPEVGPLSARSPMGYEVLTAFFLHPAFPA